MPAPTYRGRFAPSPSGPLHFGSLLAALGSWLLARQAGGEWRVRIEDIDPPRTVAGAAASQLRTLAAFGLQPDGEVVRQSERHCHYQRALERLLDEGHAFRCACSRSDLTATRGIHHRCVRSTVSDRSAVRLRLSAPCRIDFVDALQGACSQDVWADVGDFVLRRGDGHWAYQLAVVVDDAAQGITDVVRGADLLDSTPRQILLQRRLGLPQPRYLHLPLVRDASGRKLSKSEAALALDDNDPLPALRHAWACLGQARNALPRHASIETMLRRMTQQFRAETIPPRLPIAPSSARHSA